MKKNNALFTLIMIVATLFIMDVVVLVSTIKTDHEIIKTSRVINYAGIVRGATQRLVKLEITNNPNDKLNYYVGDVLKELQTDDTLKYDLIKLDDEAYLKKLNELSAYWLTLKEEIYKIRSGSSYEQTNIVTISEEHFVVADEAVSLAEEYSEKLILRSITYKGILFVFVTLLIFAIIFLAFKLATVQKKQTTIVDETLFDNATNLFNKAKCEQVFEDFGILNIDEIYAVVMFDLHDLKITNDNYGHKLGDELILNFANILKKNVISNCFVARYGGDEFLVVFENTDEDQVLEFINRIKRSTVAFNTKEKDLKYKLSFAVGHRVSKHEVDLTFDVLLNDARDLMIKNKAGREKTSSNAF